MIAFTVYGKPQPQGSIRAFMPKGAKHPVLTSDNAKLKPWRQQVSATVWAEMTNKKLRCLDRSVAVRLSVIFYFAKPKSTKKSVIEKTTKPDLSKLIRAVEDGLIGIVYQDDSQIVEYGRCSKQFGIPERTEVSVAPIFSTSADLEEQP